MLPWILNHHQSSHRPVTSNSTKTEKRNKYFARINNYSQVIHVDRESVNVIVRLVEILKCFWW